MTDQTQPDQPPTQQIYPSQPQWAAHRPTNGLAVASMVLGIVWVYWIGSILAVIFGHVALRGIKRTGHGGRGMAIAGLVLGYVGLATLAAVVIAVLVAGGSSNGNFDTDFTPSSEVRLTELHNQCATGDMYACDQLFVESPIGSAEETFGDDCAGRGSQVGVWCSARGKAEFG